MAVKYRLTPLDPSDESADLSDHRVLNSLMYDMGWKYGLFLGMICPDKPAKENTPSFVVIVDSEQGSSRGLGNPEINPLIGKAEAYLQERWGVERLEVIEFTPDHTL